MTRMRKARNKDAALTVRNVKALIEAVVIARQPQGFSIIDGEVCFRRDVVEQVAQAAPRSEVEMAWMMFTLAVQRSVGESHDGQVH